MTQPAAGPPRWSVREAVVVSLGYLGVALVVFWDIWSSGPTTTTMCACGDSARYLWFMSWPAWAISHGHGLFWSTRLFPPTGFNILDDTSVLAFGVPLAPLTMLVGPVFSLNVALTLAPVASALAMFVLLRRWVRWRPAAFIGGLAFGFSFWTLTGLTDGWLNLTLVIAPLLAVCLDELLVTRRHRPSRVGVVLGLLVVVQFFISTELLVIFVLLIGATLVAMVVGSALARRTWLATSWRPVATGLAIAVGVSAVLLAYPVWFALAGPHHLTGRVWPSITPGWYGLTPAAFVHTGAAGGAAAARRVGGYQGRTFPAVASLGWPLIGVVALALVVLRRQARAWLLAGVGLLAAWASLSSDRALNHFPVPFDVLAHLPVIENVLPIRFVAGVTFATCALVALAADQVRSDVLNVRSTVADREPRELLGALGGALVLVVAFGQLCAAVAAAVPLTTQPASSPRWFASHGRHLTGNEVVLTYPAPFSGIQAPLAWQAMDRLTYAMAGGDGPRSALRRAGMARAGEAVLADLTWTTTPQRDLTAAGTRALGEAIRAWGVTLIVIPDPRELHSYETGNNTTAAAALVSGTLGMAPIWQDGAWVWPVPRNFTSLPAATVRRCEQIFGSDPGAAARCSANGGKSSELASSSS